MDILRMNVMKLLFHKFIRYSSKNKNSLELQTSLEPVTINDTLQNKCDPQCGKSLMAFRIRRPNKDRVPPTLQTHDMR